MVRVTLTTNTGETLELQVKTGWQDLTAAEYIELRGKGDTERLPLITGLTAEQVQCLDAQAAHYLAALLSGFEPLPEVPCPVNVEGSTVGQFETVKSFLRRYYREDAATARDKALPYAYGQYMAEYPAGEWSNRAAMATAEQFKAMPAGEVVPVALAILKEIERVSRMYEALGEDESGSGDEAGEDEMEVFGFHNVRHLLSGGDILKHSAIMQLSVREVYTHLFYLKTLAARQKEEANG